MRAKLETWLELSKPVIDHLIDSSLFSDRRFIDIDITSLRDSTKVVQEKSKQVFF